MSTRAIWISIAVVVAGGLGYFYFFVMAPQQVPDRQQVLRLIADVERSIEQKRISGVMEHISEDYEDSYGFTYRMIQRLVISGARGSTTFNLSVQVPEMEIDGDRASFVAEVAYTTGDRPVTPSDARHLTVVGQLQRERGTWKVISAEGWQHAEGYYR